MTGEDGLIQAALARGYLSPDQLSQARALEADLARQGRSPGLLALLGQRYLTPAQVAELRSLWQQPPPADGFDPAAVTRDASAADVPFDPTAMTRDSSAAPFDPDAVTRDGGPTLAPAGSPSSSTGSGSGLWQPGTRVGDLVLERKLGQGGVGVVYLATHVKTGASYAVKALSLRASRVGIERFKREAVAMAELDKHINILRIHFAGEAQGHLYFAMDVAPGGDLAERLERDGPFGPAAGAQLVATLGKGLAHAHAHGILHRDLKPHNVMFGMDDVPKLADFGLARIAGEESLTKTGAMLGTPAYMAPEQVRGEKRSFDQRTDVYGLGAILYHVLTGGHPFPGAESMPMLVAKVLNQPPEPPSARREGIPPELDAITLKALSKLPEDRYPSVAAMVADLEAVASGSDVEVSTTSGLTRLRRRVAGHRLLSAGVALGVVLAAGTALLLSQGLGLRSVTPEERAAIAAADAATSRAREASRVCRLRGDPEADLSAAMAALQEAERGLTVAGGDDAPLQVRAAAAGAARAASLLGLDALLAAGDVAGAQRLLVELPESPERVVRQAGILLAKGAEAAELEALARPLEDREAQGEVLLLAARAALAAGKHAQANVLLERVAVQGLASHRAFLSARARVEEALAAELGPRAVKLLVEARELDADVAQEGAQGVVEAALAAPRAGPALERATAVFDELLDVGFTLPKAAAASYLELAAAREGARSWAGVAESITRARGIDPDLTLPGSLGLSLTVHGQGLIGQGKLAEGLEVLCLGTRAGIPCDLSRDQIRALYEEGVLDRAIERRPEDWTARYWRARAIEGRPTPTSAQVALADIDVVIAAELVPRWLLVEARTLRPNLWTAAGGVPLLLEEVDAELTETPEPWRVRVVLVLGLLRNGGHPERMLAEARKASLELKDARGLPGLPRDRLVKTRRRGYEVCVRALCEAGQPQEALDVIAGMPSEERSHQDMVVWRCRAQLLVGDEALASAALEDAVGQAKDWHRRVRRQLLKLRADYYQRIGHDLAPKAQADLAGQ